jgi:S-adenosylmethionine:tRNA ribosyltransferase-isomerase
MKMEKINIEDYNYDLPVDRIAQYPVEERDMSQLLVLRGNRISKDTFKNLAEYIPANSLLVFNNTRVIRARLLFKKETGAAIEILCLEPLSPKEYELSFSSMDPVEWKCIIGNLKKWKKGKLTTSFCINNKDYSLIAEKIKSEGDAWRIRFSWEGARLSFGEVIEAAGHIPLPPYLNREDEKDDYIRYQTVYSTENGSIAAPTAGLHFTDQVFESLSGNGIKRAELTLHVGAGTFQPVKASEVAKHVMHCEHFRVSAGTISRLIENLGNIIAVGTTSVRTLESLYWLGVKISEKGFEFKGAPDLGQWEPYELVPSLTISESLGSLLNLMKKHHITELEAATSIMIVPGYDFRVVNGIITNFHQPCSTLLLLISAWIGEKWKDVYSFALENNFRFLSYGDSSVLLR